MSAITSAAESWRPDKRRGDRVQQRERSVESLLAGQKRILELVATGAPLAETMDELTRFVEAQEAGLRCGILLVAGDGGRFGFLSGSGLPAAYREALLRVPIGPPYAAPCGEVADMGVPVMAPDIASDTRWSDEWRSLALSCGLAACRSTPVIAADGRVLASLETCWSEPRDPNPSVPDLIDIATHLAGIAIARDRSQAELWRREEQLQKELAAMQRLQEISTMLIREGDPDALYHRLLDASIAVMGSDMASMQMLDQTRGQLRLLAWNGFHPDSANAWEWVGVDSESVCGKALDAGERIVVADVETSETVAGTDDLREYRRSGIRAVQSTPLMSRSGRVLGMISTHWARPHQPTEQDFHALDLLARQAADLIERLDTEQALRERTAQLEAVLETAPAGVWFTTDPEVRRATGNRHAAEMFRTPETANLSLTAPEEEERPSIEICRDGRPLGPDELPLQRAARGEPVAEEELEFRYADGDGMTVLLRASTLRDSDGNPAGAVAAAVDISARKRAEEALRESEKRFREMADSAPMMIWVTDPDDQVTFMSRTWEEFTGQHVEEALGMGWLECVHPEDRQRVGGASRPVQLRVEYRLRHRDGGWRWVIDAAAPRFNAAGKFLGHIGSVADITDRMAVERALREREERLRLIVDSAREYAIVTLDGDRRITSWNSGAERLLGYREKEILGQLGDVFFTSEDRAAGAPEEELALAVVEGRATNERWHMRKDGSRFWGSGVMLPLASGSESGFVKIFRDRTSEREAEEALAEVSERARSLAAERAAVLGQLAEGVIVTDTEGRITFVNEAAERIHGVARLDVAPSKYASVFHLFTEDGKPYPTEQLPLSRAVLHGETVTEARWRIRRPDGTEVLAIGNASPVRGADGKIIGSVLTLRDDTAREAGERELREADLRKNIALGAGKMGVWDWDMVEDRLVWDDAEFALYGVDSKTFQPSNELFESFIHPDDLEPFKAAADAAVRSGSALETEYRIIRADGQERWIGERAVVLKNGAGQAIRMIGVSFDITERKRAEERRSLLINELNHRVKNTLATVQSIASQTLRNSEIGLAVREAFESRLISLSKTHDVLTRQNWEGARLAEIAAQSLRPFQAAGEPRIDVSGPDVRLPPKAALAISMAFHELATNAVKYGALSNEAGRVRLRWRVAKGGVLSMDWRESGGPRVEAPRRKGFGSRLVERSLAAELGGKVTMEYRRSGVACRIEAPMAGMSG